MVSFQEVVFARESNRTREEDSTQFEDSEMLQDAQIEDAFGMPM